MQRGGGVQDEAYYLDRGISHESIHGLLVHGMAAQDVWLRRWRGNGRAGEAARGLKGR